MDQAQYNQLLAFLCDGSFPAQFSKNEKDVLRKKSKSFIVKDQMLFYINGKGADLQLYKVRSQLNVLYICYTGIVFTDTSYVFEGCN